MSEIIRTALRNLVASMFEQCVGAHGSDAAGYQGQFDDEIQNVVDAIEWEIESRKE